MDFDLQALLAAHRRDGYELYGRYLNPQQPRVLHAIGFDKVYERAEGPYLYDAQGNQYADFLAGFGVFAAGRNHPVIRQALHDALDAQLADWTQFDCGALLICDEVQTGLGRTGKWFAYQHEDVVPDIVTVAKALSGGYVPVGAMLAKGWIFEKVFSNMDRVMVHSTTFKAGVLAMTAGLAALQVHDDEHLTENAARTGEALKTALTAMAEKYDVLADVRGRGLMIGLEFGKPSSLRARTSWNMLQKARVGLFAQMVVVAVFQL